jgi:hypothetical protein
MDYFLIIECIQWYKYAKLRAYRPVLPSWFFFCHEGIADDVPDQVACVTDRCVNVLQIATKFQGTKPSSLIIVRRFEMCFAIITK